ncbi:unnamed protein product, partial [Sphenostylis stenocarpa]
IMWVCTYTKVEEYLNSYLPTTELIIIIHIKEYSGLKNPDEWMQKYTAVGYEEKIVE